MVLSKLLKKPSANLPTGKAKAKGKAKAVKEDSSSSCKKGSMNDSIQRMKSSACLGAKAEADDSMDVDEPEAEDDAFVSRDKGFALKFQKMKKDLPGYVVDLIETQSAKAAHPRDFKSRMINKLFTRESRNIFRA